MGLYGHEVIQEVSNNNIELCFEVFNNEIDSSMIIEEGVDILGKLKDALGKLKELIAKVFEKIKYLFKKKKNEMYNKERELDKLAKEKQRKEKEESDNKREEERKNKPVTLRYYIDLDSIKKPKDLPDTFSKINHIINGDFSDNNLKEEINKEIDDIENDLDEYSEYVKDLYKNIKYHDRIETTVGEIEDDPKYQKHYYNALHVLDETQKSFEKIAEQINKNESEFQKLERELYAKSRNIYVWGPDWSNNTEESRKNEKKYVQYMGAIKAITRTLNKYYITYSTVSNAIDSLEMNWTNVFEEHTKYMYMYM